MFVFERPTFEEVENKITGQKFENWKGLLSDLRSIDEDQRLLLIKLSIDKGWPLPADLISEVNSDVNHILGVLGESAIADFDNGCYPMVKTLYWYYDIPDYYPPNEHGVRVLSSSECWKGLENLDIEVSSCFYEFKHAFKPLVDSGDLSGLISFGMNYYCEYGVDADFADLFFYFLDSDVEEVSFENVMIGEYEGVDVPSTWNPNLRLLRLYDVGIMPEDLRSILVYYKMKRLEEFVYNPYPGYRREKDDGLIKHLDKQGFGLRKLDLTNLELNSKSYDVLTKSSFRKRLVELRVEESRRPSKSYSRFLEAIRDDAEFCSLKEYSLGGNKYKKIDGDWVLLESPKTDEETFKLDFF